MKRDEEMQRYTMNLIECSRGNLTRIYLAEYIDIVFLTEVVCRTYRVV